MKNLENRNSIPASEPTPEESKIFGEIESLVNEGWEFLGNHYTFDEQTKKHFYEIKLKLGEKTKSFKSERPFPKIVDAKNKAIGNENPQ